MVKKILRTEEDRKALIQLLNDKKLDRPLVVEITVFRKCRSLSQNNLLHLWLRCIAEETQGSQSKYEIDTLRNHFCEKYLGWSEETVLGEYHRKTRGTSKLNTKEFTDFLEEIRMDMMHNQNIYLPLPEERGWDEFYEKYKHVETKGWVEECQ
jgi:hypothetical protein